MTKMPPETVFAAFEQTALRWLERDFLTVMPDTAEVYGIPAGTITYHTAYHESLSRAEAFDAAGYRRGMRVAVLLENRPDYFLIWLALNRLGVSVVPINPDLRQSEQTYLIGHSEPALVIAIPARQEELRKAATSAGLSVDVIGPGDSIPVPKGGGTVADILDGEAQEAALLYTSGTTGHPKGCVLPNTYFLLAGEWYRNVGGLADLSETGERMITPLPVFHMNAMAYSFMAMVAVGGCLIALDRFHPATWWSDVRNSGATCLHYLGVMPTMLMRAPPSPKDQTHSVRFGFGAGIDPKLHQAFETRFAIPLVEAWAMTETGAGAVIAANTHDRLIGQSSLGTPAPDIACKIVNEAGQEVPHDTPGELWVRRAKGDPKYGFFSHYYKNPQATDQAWEGGWFHTGDLVRQSPKGDIFFVDRKKNVIRRSGENIAAVEVESVLMRHPDIKAVGVTAVPDPIRGDEVFACIVSDSPTKDTAHAITAWCLQVMAYYKAPGFIAFVDALPLTPTQKIQRAELKTRACALLNTPETINTGHLKKRQVA